MNIKNEDTVAGGALLALAAAITWLSMDIGTGAGGATLKPNFFPLVCAVGLALCGAILAVRGLRSSVRELPSLIDPRFGIVATVLVVFFWGFTYIDFRVGAWAVTLVCMLAFGMRRPVILLIYPIALSATLYFAFSLGFNVVLPTWI